MTEENANQRLGVAVSGSPDRGVEAKLDSSASVEDMVVGRYVTIEGRKRRFAVWSWSTKTRVASRWGTGRNRPFCYGGNSVGSGQFWAGLGLRDSLERRD